MLTRKQQWRRARVRRSAAPQSFACRAAAGVADDASKNHNKPKGQLAEESHTERDRDRDSTSTSSTISTWSSSSFDSLRDHDDDDDGGEDGGCCGDVSPPPADRGVKHTVSFREEVQVFLVKHKSELDTRYEL